MTLREESVTARHVLEVVVGDRCPCGHAKGTHRPPALRDVERFGASMGACRAKGCDCKGLAVLPEAGE